MKKIFLLFFPVLSLSSCYKGNDFPREESTIAGSRWGIKIGSSPADVYGQIQVLGREKDFTDLAVAYRQPYSKPQEIQDLLGFYDYVTLLNNNTPVIDRVVIQFTDNRVNSLSAGGAMPEEISKWPPEASDEAAIHENDPVDGLYAKLLAIYQMPAYSNYTINFPNKPLAKPFDPDMAHYEEWGFSMSVDVKPGRRGSYSVRLIFRNDRLVKIQSYYNEGQVYN